MEPLATYADFQSVDECRSLLERLFATFGLISVHLRPVPVPPEAVDFKIYRLTLETESAPLVLVTPEDRIGGLQFSLMQRRFVYRYDNCVLSFETSCYEGLKRRPWMIGGALYVTPSIGNAQDLVEKLIQILPKTVESGSPIQQSAVPAIQHECDVSEVRA